MPSTLASTAHFLSGIFQSGHVARLVPGPYSTVSVISLSHCHRAPRVWSLKVVILRKGERSSEAKNMKIESLAAPVHMCYYWFSSLMNEVWYAHCMGPIWSPLPSGRGFLPWCPILLFVFWILNNQLGNGKAESQAFSFSFRSLLSKFPSTETSDPHWYWIYTLIAQFCRGTVCQGRSGEEIQPHPSGVGDREDWQMAAAAAVWRTVCTGEEPQSWGQGQVCVVSLGLLCQAGGGTCTKKYTHCCTYVYTSTYTLLYICLLYVFVFITYCTLLITHEFSINWLSWCKPEQKLWPQWEKAQDLMRIPPIRKKCPHSFFLTSREKTPDKRAWMSTPPPP